MHEVLGEMVRSLEYSSVKPHEGKPATKQRKCSPCSQWKEGQNHPTKTPKQDQEIEHDGGGLGQPQLMDECWSADQEEKSSDPSLHQRTGDEPIPPWGVSERTRENTSCMMSGMETRVYLHRRLVMAEMSTRPCLVSAETKSDPT